MHRMTTLLLCAPIALTMLGGCVSGYHTPGGPAKMNIFGLSDRAQHDMTDPAIRQVVMKEPLASFPAGLAIVRVQAPGYHNHCVGSYGRGAYSVVTTKDIETDQDLDRIRNLPQVRSVSPVSRLMLPETLDSDLDLRRAAAALGADILVIYTFDTQYKNDDWAPPLALVTLGIFPTEKTKVTTNVTAVLLDVRNGYVYGAMEATSKQSRINNYWTDDEAADSARKEAEREALDDLLASMERTWIGVVATYAPLRAARPTLIYGECWPSADVNRLVGPEETNPPPGRTYWTHP